MRSDHRRFQRRRRARTEMAIAFSVAVIGALALVAMRSCTDNLDGMYQGGGANQSQPSDQNLNKERLEKLKKMLKENGGMQKLLQKEGVN